MVNRKNLQRLQERQPLYASCIPVFAKQKLEVLHSEAEPSPALKNFIDVLQTNEIINGYETLEQDLEEITRICG